MLENANTDRNRAVGWRSFEIFSVRLAPELFFNANDDGLVKSPFSNVFRLQLADISTFKF